MATHIHDAIALNRQRLHQYAALTNNESIPFSRKLIRQERFALLPAFYFDRMALKFQRKGIDIIMQEFVPMQDVPSFSSTYPSHINYAEPLQKVHTGKLVKALFRANQKKAFGKIVDVSNEQISELAKQPHVYCMLRHLLESVRRCAFYANIHMNRAAEEHYASPAFLSKQLIWLHLVNLNTAKRFDENIAFIQEKGIPFIYQDLPKIGLASNHVNNKV